MASMTCLPAFPGFPVFGNLRLSRFPVPPIGDGKKTGILGRDSFHSPRRIRKRNIPDKEIQMSEIQVTEALLLMHCCALKTTMQMYLDADRMKEYRSTERDYKFTRKEIRKMLRARGFERDIEISGEMDRLARVAHEAHRELNWCIMKQDRKAAALLAKLGHPELLIEQQMRDAPLKIRYRREIEYAKNNLAWHYKVIGMNDPTKKLTEDEIDALVAAHFGGETSSQ
jgi:hypothetical protein